MRNEGRYGGDVGARPRPSIKPRFVETQPGRRGPCVGSLFRCYSQPGLDHFEGRSWRGLHHHALLCLLAFAFLQHLRLGGKKASRGRRPDRRPGRACPRVRRRIVAALTRVLLCCPHCRQRFEHHLRL